MDDLKRWYHKIKPGGIISGDDYRLIYFKGLTDAVNEYFYNTETQLEYCWVRRKPKIQINDVVREMTTEEHNAYKAQQAEAAKAQAATEAKAAARESALAKLAALGLSAEEIAAL